MQKRVLIGLIGLLSILLVLQGCSSASKQKYAQEDIDTLAQCLTENDVVMYGAFWCPHCAKTKKKFGSSFGYINYVECDPKCKPDENGVIHGACQGHEGQPELCLERDIEGYDTWILGDGTRAIGEPSLELLDERSGCHVLPGSE